MNDRLRVVPGDRAVLISIPHDGRDLPAPAAAAMTEAGRAQPDADWHVSSLYRHRRLRDCARLEARWSRYLIDLNRPADSEALYPGQDETGLCPLTTFAHDPIYQEGRQPDTAEISERIERYWSPYHQALAAALDELVRAHGRALLWDGHSIRSRVPRFFEGVLPDFSFGTDGGRTCPTGVTDALAARVREAGFSAVVNGRFRGGYTTRHHAAPERRIHAIQLELSQATYLDEETLTPRAADAAAVAELIADLVGLAEELLA